MNRSFALFGCLSVAFACTTFSELMAQDSSISKKTSSSFSAGDPTSIYKLSVQRTELIKSIVDGYSDASGGLEDDIIIKHINDDISKLMPLVPKSSLTVISAKELSEKAKAKMVEKYGQDVNAYDKTLQEDAQKKYPMYKLKDTVTVEYNKGPKQYRVVGKLYKVTLSAIIVDDTAIDFVDLPSETRACFDEQWNRYLRSQYVETHRIILARERAAESQGYYEQFKAQLYQKNEAVGFIYIPSTDSWSSAKDIAQNYIELLKKKQAEKLAAEKAAADAAAKNEESQFDKDNDEKNNETKIDSKKTSSEKKVVSVDTSKFTIEDTEENQAIYEKVKAKFDENIEKLSDASGIDAYPAYKQILWGFSISETRFSLWKEPEFKYLEQSVGRDIINFPADSKAKDKELGLEIRSVDFVYHSNKLSKVVYSVKDTSRKDFSAFKDSMTEKFGSIRENKGKDDDYLLSITNGKLENKTISGEKDIEYPKEFVYVAQRVEFKKTDSGEILLPFTMTWKGEKTQGTVFFYYNKVTDTAENILFVKETILSK